MGNIIQSIPEAKLLLASLRSVGYTEETAIADIVDNCISAKAKHIDIIFETEKMRILILDDGIGMTAQALIENMRIGSSDPSKQRDDTDLGRFGMGMKTAAFSLGKRLTVVTRFEETTSNAAWDLDKIPDIGWNLIIEESDSIAEISSRLGAQGTVAFKFCEKLIQEQNTDIGAAVTETTEKYSFIISDKELFAQFLFREKKNATVLRRILRFFRKNQCAEVIDGKKIITAKYPALIIDDEADQASINTNDSYDEKGNLLDDYNPTTINGLIREILKTFECRSYVGYTATPFANIFIPPHINSERYGTDLFPRDFVFRTPRADQYIGAREFFGLSGDENTPVMPLCRDIIAGASYLGKGTKAGDPVGNIPEELYWCHFRGTTGSHLQG